MNKIERIEYLKNTIDELRSDGCNKLADIFCDDLAKEVKGVTA